MSWWAGLEGAERAVDDLKGYRANPVAQNAWYSTNKTKLWKDPTLVSAAVSSGMDYATARRLSIVWEANNSIQQGKILQQGGVDQSLWPNSVKTPDVQKAKEAGKLDAAADDGSFWDGVWGALADFGKGIWEGVGTALNAISSPIQGPIAAGQAQESATETGMKSAAFKAMPGFAKGIAGAGLAVAQGVEDFGRGVGDIVGGVGDQQAKDMRNQGYDPDDFVSRYAYYANFNEGGRVANRVAANLKQQYPKWKVDLAREVVTSGVLDDETRYKGLSPQAQVLLDNSMIRRSDKAGEDIITQLYDPQTLSFGANVADMAGLKPGTGKYAATSALADLAAYWYVDPLVAAGGALKATRAARYAIDGADPEAVKHAIAAGGKEAGPVGRILGAKTSIGKRWDDILDRVDRIHVLSTSGRQEDVVRAADEFTKFRQLHPDTMPLYETLRGLREGSIKGSFHEAPRRNIKFNSAQDFANAGIGVERVSDPKLYKPAFQLRKDASELDKDIGGLERGNARAAIAERVSDALTTAALGEGRPLIHGRMLLPGQIAMTGHMRAAVTPLMDGLLGQNKKLEDALTSAQGKGVVNFNNTGQAVSPDAAEVVSATGGEWLRKHYNKSGIGPQGMRDRVARSFAKGALFTDAPNLYIDRAGSTETFHNFARMFMPRSMAAYAANAWSRADPATRSVMIGNMREMAANARRALDSNASRDFWNQQLKGREGAAGARALEAYSTPELDEVETPAGPITAAMWGTQFSDGVQLPRYVDILRNTEKVGLFSFVAGMSHSRVADAFTRAWKITKVGTLSNALRQVYEGRVGQVMEDWRSALRTQRARIGLVGATAQRRADINSVIRQAKLVRDSGVHDQMAPLLRTGYQDMAIDLARRAAGVKTLHPELEDIIGKSTDISHLKTVADSRSAVRLATTATVADPLRRLRARLYRPLTKEATEDFAYDWLSRVNAGMDQDLADGMEYLLGSQTSRWMDGGLAEDLAHIQTGLSGNVGMAKLKLANTQGYLGTAGDVGATRWANALGHSVNDQLGNVVVRATAHQHLYGDLKRFKKQWTRELVDADPEVRRLRGIIKGHKSGKVPAPLNSVKLFRVDNLAQPAAPETKAHGVHYSFDRPGFVSPYLGFGPSQHRMHGLPANDPGVLNLGKINVPDPPGNPNFGFRNPGVAALWTMVPQKEWDHLNNMQPRDLRDYILTKFPNLKVKMFPASHRAVVRREGLLEVYGAALARQRGYKAVVRPHHTDPNEDEYLALGAGSALDTAGAQLASNARAIAAARKQLQAHITAKHGATIQAVKAWNTPEDVAKHMLVDHEYGEPYRVLGRRGKYLNGVHVGDQVGTPDHVAALHGWAGQMVEDANLHLGMSTPFAANGVPQEIKPLLKTLAKKRQVSVRDLHQVPEEFRPDKVHAPIIVGKRYLQPEGMLNKLSEGATKWYDFSVGNVVKRMVHDPQIVAAKHEAMVAMEPLARKLANEGWSSDSIYRFLDTQAIGHALTRVSRYSDNPQVQSYFSALSNNLLWFERATEDFVRRFLRVSKADPAVLARGQLMLETGLHSGMLYEQPITDDDGETKTEMVFTFPGSGLLMRGFNEAARSLGIVDEDVIRTPVYQDLSAPVKYLNPSSQNPIGFSMTPMMGIPLKLLRNVFPDTTLDVNNALTALNGGERQFAQSSAWEELMPVYIARLYHAVDGDTMSGQIGSQTKNVAMYMKAAGRLPAADASTEDHQRAMDELRENVQANMVFQAIFSSLAPASATTFGTNPMEIGDDQDTLLAKVTGANTIRSEFYSLLEVMNKRHPNSAQAYAEASTAFLKRYQGSKTILNPEAFTVGSSGAPGHPVGDSFPSSKQLTQWMLEHKDFLAKYGQAAYLLLPDMAGPYYDQVGYKTQLNAGLRQHKDFEEFYYDLIKAQGDRQYYALQDARDRLLDGGVTPEEQVYSAYDARVDELKRAFPKWAELKFDDTTNFVTQTIAPRVRQLADLRPRDMPKEMRKYKKPLQTMADLYDDYQEAVAQYPGSGWDNRNQRSLIAGNYRDRGDEMFKDGPLGDLWSSMRIYE